MERKSLFQCPVCKKALVQGEKEYRCNKGHSFDISRKGYVNLLLPNHKGSGNPGDSKEMLQSRRDFLNKGYYEGFSDRLNALSSHYIPNDDANGISILDAGCGEGYYLSRLKNSLWASGMEKSDIYGIDVSKAAINLASGRDKAIRFAVASTYHLPLLDRCLDGILCIFSPRDEKEFLRVLKPKGKLIVAAPGPKHLYSFKKKLYENPEYIGQKGTVGEGFSVLECVNITYGISLESTLDIMNLLSMTPYTRHTDQDAVEKLKRLNALETEVDINIIVYQKLR